MRKRLGLWFLAALLIIGLSLFVRVQVFDEKGRPSSQDLPSSTLLTDLESVVRVEVTGGSEVEAWLRLVHADTREPIAHAEVESLSIAVPESNNGHESEPEYVCDLAHEPSEQRYRVQLPLDSQSQYSLRIRVRAEGYVNCDMLQAIAAGSQVELGLIPDATCFGFVVDENDEPVVGAHLRLRFPASVRARWSQLRSYDTVTTGEVAGNLYFNSQADGRFGVFGLIPGLGYRLDVSCPGYVSRTVTFDVPAGESELATIRLRAGLTLRGFVRGFSSSATPFDVAVKAQVRSAVRREAGPQAAVQDGIFEFQGLVPGEKLVWARRYIEREQTWEYATASCQLDTHSPDLELVVASRQVLFRVVDGNGEPVPEASVLVVPPANVRIPGQSWKTDEGGLVTVRGLPVGKMGLFVDPPDPLGKWDTLSTNVEIPQQSEYELVLELAPKAPREKTPMVRIEVDLVDYPDGEPRRIFLVREGNLGYVSSRKVTGSVANTMSVRADESAQLRIEVLGEGRWGASEWFYVSDAPSAVSVRHWQSTSVCSGRVLAVDGQAARGEVWLFGPGDENHHLLERDCLAKAALDEDGWFTLEGAPPDGTLNLQWVSDWGEQRSRLGTIESQPGHVSAGVLRVREPERRNR